MNTTTKHIVQTSIFVSSVMLFMVSMGTSKSYAYDDHRSKNYNQSSRYSYQSDWNKQSDDEDAKQHYKPDIYKDHPRLNDSLHSNYKTKDYSPDDHKSAHTSSYNRSNEQKSYSHESDEKKYEYSKHDSNYSKEPKKNDEDKKDRTWHVDEKKYDHDKKHSQNDNVDWNKSQHHSDRKKNDEAHKEYVKKSSHEKKYEKNNDSNWHVDKNQHDKKPNFKTAYERKKWDDKDDCEKQSRTSTRQSSYKPHYSKHQYIKKDPRYNARYTTHHQPSYKSVHLANWKEGHHMNESQNEIALSLRSNLQEHAAVVLPALRAHIEQTPDREAALGAVDQNTEAVADIVDMLYDDSKDEFTDLWESHIDAYLMAATATRDHDETGTQEAKSKLSMFATDATDWFAAQNPEYDSNTLQDLFSTHGEQTLGIIEKIAAKDYEGVYKTAHEAYVHMGMVADYLAGMHTSESDYPSSVDHMDDTDISHERGDMLIL